MNKRTKQNFGRGTRAGVRPVLLVGVLAVAGLILLAVLFVGRKSPSPTTEGETGTASVAATPDPLTSETTAVVAAANTAISNSIAGAGTATTGTVAQAGEDAATLRELIRKLKDPSLLLDARKAVIKALAQNGSPEAIAALKEALGSGAEELRAAIAEGLGECSSPECTTMLLGLLNDASESVIQAAMQGLAQQGSPQAIAALNQFLTDPLRSENLRGEAAAALGKINQPGALEALTQAVVNITDEGIVTRVLDAIGGRQFSETESFFQNYLRSPNVSSDLRVAAIESLAQAQGDPSRFLATYVSDVDSEVRASAAWTLSATDENGKLGAQLQGLLQAESDADVRLRLYQALGNQDGYDVASVMAMVQKETEQSSSVAGLNLLAKTLQKQPTPELQAYFDQTAAPALKNIALNGEDAHDRMVAIIALINSQSASAIPVLQQISQQATDRKVADAAAQATTAILRR